MDVTLSISDTVNCMKKSYSRQEERGRCGEGDTHGVYEFPPAYSNP